MPYLSLEKEKENVCAVFTNSIEREREIFKFHVGRKRSWCTRNVVVLLIYTYRFSAVLVVVAVVLALKALYRCDPEFLLPWQRDVTLLLSINILV